MAVLKSKSKGKDVAALQEALNKNISAKLNADGIFGKATKVAVIKFQKKNSLKADGVAGASTLAVLGLGPSLKFPKMKVKDFKEDLKWYEDKESLQWTGGPEQFAREMANIKPMLRKLEAQFVAMEAESNKIQKDVVKHHAVVLAAAAEIVEHQKEYAASVKNNDVDGAALMASGAESLFATFKKSKKALYSVQKMQQQNFTGKFFALMDKTFT